MKKLLPVAFVWLALYVAAQAPVNYYTVALKGPVLKKEELSFLDLKRDASGQPVFDQTPNSQVIMYYKDGFATSAVYYKIKPSGERAPERKIEFTYTNDHKVSSVKEYTASGADNWTLALNTEISFKKGRAVTETVYDKDQKLVASFDFLPSYQLNGLPVVVLQEYGYENGKKTKKGLHGIQRDTNGIVVLQYQISPDNDTVSCVRVTRRDAELSKISVYSPIQKKSRDVEMVSKRVLDSYGNPVTQWYHGFGERWMGGSKTRYHYAGQPDWEPVTSFPAAIQIPAPMPGGQAPSATDAPVEVEELAEQPVEEPKLVPQTAPEFPGGSKALEEAIQKELKYPKPARKNGIQGIVALKVTVEATGELSDIRILRDIGADCGKEAIRIVKTLPRFTPARENGRAVRSETTIRVRFSLD